MILNESRLRPRYPGTGRRYEYEHTPLEVAPMQSNRKNEVAVIATDRVSKNVHFAYSAIYQTHESLGKKLEVHFVLTSTKVGVEKYSALR